MISGISGKVRISGGDENAGSAEIDLLLTKLL